MFGIVRAAAAAAALFMVASVAQAETSSSGAALAPAQAQASLVSVSAFDLDGQHKRLTARPYQPVVTLNLPRFPVSGPAAIRTSEKALTRSLPDLVSAYMHLDPEDSEGECLAGAVYFESKGEPLEGQLAVAEVILNRVASGRYPPTICGVVKQKAQFSFVRRGQIPFIAKASEAWRRAVAVAHIAKAELADGGIGNAMFFHANYVAPNWRRLTRVASIGNHIFYRH